MKTDLPLKCGKTSRVVVDGFLAIHYVGAGRNGYGFLGILAPPNVHIASPTTYMPDVDDVLDILADGGPLLVEELRLPSDEKRPREVEVRVGHGIRVNREMTLVITAIHEEHIELHLFAERYVEHKRLPLPERPRSNMPSLMAACSR